MSPGVTGSITGRPDECKPRLVKRASRPGGWIGCMSGLGVFRFSRFSHFLPCRRLGCADASSRFSYNPIVAIAFPNILDE
jgi:hypothetical protein